MQALFIKWVCCMKKVLNGPKLYPISENRITCTKPCWEIIILKRLMFSRIWRWVYEIQVSLRMLRDMPEKPLTILKRFSNQRMVKYFRLLPTLLTYLENAKNMMRPNQFTGN